MTGNELKAARQEMGLSQTALADLLRLGPDSKRGGDRVRDMEAGRRNISPPLGVLIDALLDGWRPSTGKAEP